MIFLRLDENVSHRIAAAARAVRLPEGLVLETPFERGESGQTDLHWIESFAQRGSGRDKRCVFSGDGAIRYTEAERLAAEQAGLTMFYTPGQWWRRLGRLSQAAYVLRWLTAMIVAAESYPPGAQFRLPASFSGDPNLRPLPSVLRAAERKLAARAAAQAD